MNATATTKKEISMEVECETFVIPCGMRLTGHIEDGFFYFQFSRRVSVFSEVNMLCRLPIQPELIKIETT